MSLQWTLIAGFLYFEIGVVLLLVLPIASPRKWNSFFKSKFLLGLQRQASVYFFIVLAILFLFLLDAIREIRKYSNPEHEPKQLEAEMQGSMRLFRAQRNFYISGFSLFLSLVIRRLVSLISSQASLLAQSEAAMRQAQSASTAARTLLQKGEQEHQNEKNESQTKDIEIKELKDIIQQLEEKYERERKDKLAMKTQAENLQKEFDNVTEELSKMQKQQVVSGGDTKKDD